MDIPKIAKVVFELLSGGEIDVEIISEAIGDIIGDYDLADDITNGIIDATGFPDLSEEDIRNILRGITSSQTA